MRVWRSFQPMTSSLTLTPVSLVNSSSTGVRTSLSFARLVPWLLAQYVSVAPLDDDPDPELLQPATTSDTAAAIAATATARFLIVTPSSLDGGAAGPVQGPSGGAPGEA